MVTEFILSPKMISFPASLFSLSMKADNCFFVTDEPLSPQAASLLCQEHMCE